MRSLLTLLTRRAPRALRRPARRALSLERLEGRLAPAVTSLYVTTQDLTPGYPGSFSALKEYTQTGVLVRSLPVVTPWVWGEQARDLAVTPGSLHVYNGTSKAVLDTYTAATGSWS